jgi:hypothetical protein
VVVCVKQIDSALSSLFLAYKLRITNRLVSE